MKDVVGGECKFCNQPIKWLKGFGWTHLGTSNCIRPVPKKDSIR